MVEHILGDPGVDSGAKGKSKLVGKKWCKEKVKNFLSFFLPV